MTIVTNHGAASRFADDTCRTPQSRTSTLSTLRQLFCRYPKTHLRQFTDKQLTDFCLANNPAPATVKARRARLMGFFAWCKWQKLIDHNPASELKFTAKAGKGGGVRHHTWLSVAEYKNLLAAQPDTLEGRRARIVLMLGGMLGLRRTEIAELRWSDFSKGFEAVTLTGKGGKLAALGVPVELRNELKVWYAHAARDIETILPIITGWNDDVPDRYDWDRPITSNTVAAIVTEAGKNAGIHLECHDLRRSFAGMLEELGYSISDISRMMRHSNIGTTSTYMESNPRKTSALAEGFRLDIGGSRD